MLKQKGGKHTISIPSPPLLISYIKPLSLKFLQLRVGIVMELQFSLSFAVAESCCQLFSSE